MYITTNLSDCKLTWWICNSINSTGTCNYVLIANKIRALSVCVNTYHTHRHSTDTRIQKAGAGVGRHLALETVQSLPFHTMVLYLLPAIKNIGIQTFCLKKSIF